MYVSSVNDHMLNLLFTLFTFIITITLWVFWCGQISYISNSLDFPERFHDKCLSGRGCAIAIPPWNKLYRPRILKINSPFRKLILSYYPVSSEEWSSYWFNKNFESFNFILVISGLFVIIVSLFKSSKSGRSSV